MVDKRDVPDADHRELAPTAHASSDEHAPTLAEGTARPSQETLVPPSRPTPPVELPPSGYFLGTVIGLGGMGEVLAAHDQRIGRDVAIKRMRTPHPDNDQLMRFLREARIQARLDHPSIVPVHELGTDASGRPYFTMKRVSGKTLAQRIEEGATPQALLRAFVDVCLAVEFAHARGVIHRDLKPSNIMLGEYGEVYVLDWGIARVVTDQPDQPSDVITLDEHTQTGAMLGTPGYMAPEQIRAIPATPAADVYALGAILFEILAGEPLHPRGQAAIATTLATPQQAPAKRRADRTVAPELDALCVAALAEDLPSRPTARQLADRVQAYLDGDRDLERRRLLAHEHLERARSGLAGGGAEGRAIAIREAGLAFALAPESVEAGSLLTSMLVEPPDPLPPELQAAIDADERKLTRQRTRVGTRAYLLLFGFWPVFPFLGIKNWGWLIAIYAVIGGLALWTWLSSRQGRYNVAVGLLGNLAFAIAATRIAGTFLLAPVFACGVLLGLTTTRWVAQRRWLIVGYAGAMVLIPVGLEAIGWMPASWEVTKTSIISHSTIFAMEGTLADLAMIGGTIVLIAMFGLVSAQIHSAAKAAKRKLSIQAWHLRQLAPRGASPMVTRS